jgi:nucleoid-associated protein YgaU
VLIAGNAMGVGEVKIAGSQAAAVDDGTQYYVIKSGDTLSAIAKQFYGDPNKYPKIFEANREVIKDANLIFPGQKIRIPKA